MQIDTRRRDSSRNNEDWFSISDKINPNTFIIKKTLEELEHEITVFNPDKLSQEELNYFVQFAVVPVTQNKETGVILNDPYKRVPEFVINKFSNKIFIAPKDICVKLIDKHFAKKTKNLHFTNETKSIEAIKSILQKMETLKSSDVTMSWRRNSCSVSYAVSGKNIKEFEDSIELELADKIRISLINMSYENQSEKLIDGKFSIHIQGDLKEYRLSVIETVAGYAIVIRSYQKFNEDMSLDTLGYLDKPKEIIRNIIEKNPYGVFLVTGPTGSGKTTTIYTIINQAYKEHNLKIKTAEDPVEIEIFGIDQCQINKKGEEKHQVTYVNLLSSFMRQRPDIIVIGEIRDREVAMSAVEAALTGHVVITTLHTNNVSSTFTRLTNNLGITADRIEDGFSGVLSQRLVEKLCDCKVSDGEGGFKANENGCDKCQNSPTLGFLGQIPAVEVARLEKAELNYLQENFIEYYSYADSGKELYELGFIDKKTKGMLEILNAKKHIKE